MFKFFPIYGYGANVLKCNIKGSKSDLFLILTNFVVNLTIIALMQLFMTTHFKDFPCKIVYLKHMDISG